MGKKKNYDKLFVLLSLLVTAIVIGIGINSIRKYEVTQEVKIEDHGAQKVEVGQLENGLRYYFVSNQNDVGLCYATLRVNAGSLDDNIGSRGVAQLVGRLSFRETENYPKNTPLRYFMDRGLSHNVNTGYLSTVYQGSFSSEQKGIKGTMETTLDILSGIASKTIFSDEGITSEKRLALRELDDRKYGDKIKSVIKENDFKNTIINDFEAIGVEEEIENITKEQLEKFYATYYQPQNMDIIIVGDFNKEEVRGIIENKFGAIKSNGIEIPKRKKDLNVNLNRSIGEFSDTYGDESKFLYTSIVTQPADNLKDTEDNSAILYVLLSDFIHLNDDGSFLKFHSLFGPQKKVTFSINLDGVNDEAIVTNFFRKLKRLATQDVSPGELEKSKSKYYDIKFKFSNSDRNKHISGMIMDDFLDKGFPLAIEKIISPSLERYMASSLARSFSDVTIEDTKEMAKQIYARKNYSGMLINSVNLSSEDVNKIIRNVENEQL